MFSMSSARKNDSIGIGRPFVALDDSGVIAGHFTLATAQVKYTEIPEHQRLKLPKYPIPALSIARLASERKFQGKGVGRWLLKQAFIKAVQVADITGLYLITVDAKETSKGFYEHYGFSRLEDEELSYYMPVDTIRKAIKDA